MTFAFPDRVAGRPLWLMTLADLALLLVGFFVLLQARQVDHRALASAMRARFDAPALPSMPVAAAGLLDFAPGSAILPASPAATIAWAREVSRDPRVRLTVTGGVDGSAGDVDPATLSGAILATDRARALAVALATAGVTPGQLGIATAPRAGRPGSRQDNALLGSRPRSQQNSVLLGSRRAAIVTLGFTGPRS